MPSHGVPLSSNGSGASGLTLTPKNPLRDRRALKFYTEKIWGAPARAIPVTSCERPELPNRVEYHSARIEYHSTRPEYVPFEPFGECRGGCPRFPPALVVLVLFCPCPACGPVLVLRRLEFPEKKKTASYVGPGRVAEVG